MDRRARLRPGIRLRQLDHPRPGALAGVQQLLDTEGADGTLTVPAARTNVALSAPWLTDYADRHPPTGVTTRTVPSPAPST
ncbi:hypothetical protein ACTU45_31485, partial [Streptomyces sp. 24-1644]|uniref:hypothetical protein n=1 Tax=Streptomyces sp. 24-1644 TaxID=3457315 RepID=UPI003FA6C0B1